jgi:hypothetical protein
MTIVEGMVNGPERGLVLTNRDEVVHPVSWYYINGCKNDDFLSCVLRWAAVETRA